MNVEKLWSFVMNLWCILQALDNSKQILNDIIYRIWWIRSIFNYVYSFQSDQSFQADLFGEILNNFIKLYFFLIFVKYKNVSTLFIILCFTFTVSEIHQRRCSNGDDTICNIYNCLKTWISLTNVIKLFGATTFSIMTLSIMTLSIMTHSITKCSTATLSIMKLSVMKRSIMKLSITTFSIATQSIKGLRMTLNINNTEHNNALPLCWVLQCWDRILLILMLHVNIMNFVENIRVIRVEVMSTRKTVGK